MRLAWWLFVFIWTPTGDGRRCALCAERSPLASFIAIRHLDTVQVYERKPERIYRGPQYELFQV